ncbi:MAG: ABC transporter substrate-binding protein, partial [Deltaproteobacteria bacterium]
MIRKILRIVSIALAATTVALSSNALGATPSNTLVQAWAIDDIISLDPAEIFEFTAAEIAGNSYDRLIGYDVNDVSKVFG